MQQAEPLPEFGEGVPLAYSAEFSEVEYMKLCQGFKPRAMEDKWAVSFDEPYLHFRRSWTGLKVYRVKLVREVSAFKVQEALWASELYRENPSQAGYQADLLDFLVSNLLLGKSVPFPVPTGQSTQVQGLYQHAVAGTGYPEKAFQVGRTETTHTTPPPVLPSSKKPWWRFWQ